MISREELLQMRNMSFDDIEKESVPDISKLNIDVGRSSAMYQVVLPAGAPRGAV